jgi:exodeoxyribonuclease-3
MKLVSWNLNGIRAVEKKGLSTILEHINADIIGFQETKAQDDQVLEALKEVSGYHIFSNSAVKKGYSGTAILSKKEPIKVTYGLGIEEHDQEGRLICAEYEDFYYITVYVPNSGTGLVRLKYRTKWDNDLLEFVNNKDKPVFLCGDLNVAHQELDLKNPKSNYNKTAGYTQFEIDGMTNYINSGFTDTFRHFYPQEIKYSWWSYRFSARLKNIGWRLDYFLASEDALNMVNDAFILNDVMGSDHCPVGIELK